jgi:DNA-binding MarR family transcriptional regulator
VPTAPDAGSRDAGRNPRDCEGLAVAMLVRQVERALMPLELSLAQYRVLGLIGENDAGALFHSLRIGASRAGITLLVDGLVERGYVVRREDTHDRRRVVLELTEAGLEMWQAADDAA